MSFNAGDIEATLRASRDQFARDLDAARADADKWAAKPVTVKVTADTTAAKADIGKVAAKPVVVKVTADTTAAKADIGNVAAKDVTVKVSADTAAARAGIAAIGGKTVKVKVEADASRLAGLLDNLGGGPGGAKAAGTRAGASLGAGLLSGIGPGILGISAKIAVIGTGVSAALATLPAAAGIAGLGIGTALVGGVAAVVAGGAIAAVSPAVAAFTALKNAAPGTAQVAALKKYQAAIAQLTPAQQGLAKSVEGIQAAWQSFVASNTAGVAKIIGQGAGLLPGIFAQMSAVFNAAVPQIQAVLPVLGQVVHGFLGLAQASVPAFAPVVTALLTLVKNILPGIQVVIGAMMPFLGQFAGILSALGSHLGQFFSAAAPAIGASMKVLGTLLDLAGALLPVIMKLGGVFATALAPAIAIAAGVIKSLTPTFLIIGQIVGALAGAVLGDLSAAFSALATLVKGIAPGLGAFTRSLGLVFTTMENTGVFAIVGNAIEALAVPLAALVNALVKGLAPVLPLLFRGIGQVAGILAVGLAAAVAAALPSLTTLATDVLASIARLLPVVLPLLVTLTGLFTAAVVAAVAGVATALAAVITAIPPGVLDAITAGVLAVVAAMKLWELGALAVKGVTVALTAVQAAWAAITDFDTFALKAMYAWDILVAVAEKAWTIIQVVLDAVVAASPIMLIVLAVAALSVGIYELVTHWTTVWHAILAVTMYVWGEIKRLAADAWNFIYNGFGKYLLPLLGPVGFLALGAIEVAKHWSAITGAFAAVIDWLAGHWKLILVILTGPIGLAVLWIMHAWAGILGGTKTAVTAVSGAITGAWAHVASATQSVWGGIARFFTAWWNFEVAAWKAAVAVAAAVLAAGWHAVDSAARAAWTVIRSFFTAWWNLEAAAWKTAVAVAAAVLLAGWHAIDSQARTVFGGLRTFFTGFWGFLTAGFRDAVTGIGIAWNAIKTAVSAPVNWVVTNVYDNLIRRFWNDVAGPVGLPTLPHLAAGGIVPGGYSRTDNQLAWLRSGEGVLQPGAVAALGGPGFVRWANSAYGDVPAGSGGAGHYAGGGTVPGRAGALGAVPVTGNPLGPLAGVASFLGGLVSDVKNGIYTGLAAAGTAVIGDAAKQVPGSTGIADAMRDYPVRLWDGFTAWVTGHGPGPAAGGAVALPGGGSAAANQALGKRMAAAVGWVGAMWNALNGVEMLEAGWNTTAQNPGSGAYGIAQFINGPSEYAQYGGNSATAGGQIAGFINYIKARYGNPEAAYSHELSYHWYDNGGWLQPGTSMVTNATGRPEPVLTGEQWDALTAAVAGGGGTSQLAGTVNIMLPEGASLTSALNELDFKLHAARMQGFLAGGG
jgi:hypothetical protein